MSELAEQQEAEQAAHEAAEQAAEQARESGDAGEPVETGDVDDAAAAAAGDDVAGQADPELALEEGAPDDEDVDDQEDVDAGDVDDQPDHPDEQAVLAAADSEARLKKVSRTGDRYIKNIIEQLGPDLGGYQVCANCDGYLPGLVLLELVDDERRAAVKRQLGIDTFDDLQTDDTQFTVCQACSGRGRIRTGSTAPGKEARPCKRCAGNGYLAPGGEAPGVDDPDPQLVPDHDAEGPTDRAPFDVFGTPSWHEDYGKMVDMREVPVSHWAGNVPHE